VAADENLGETWEAPRPRCPARINCSADDRGRPQPHRSRAEAVFGPTVYGLAAPSLEEGCGGVRILAKDSRPGDQAHLVLSSIGGPGGEDILPEQRRLENRIDQVSFPGAVNAAAD
jgi:hypothetical protein